MNHDLDTRTPDLLASLRDGVLTLTLNRPDARNAMNTAMWHALADQLQAAERNAEVKCIVLTGAGAAFCSGGDMKSASAEAQAQAAGQAPLGVDERVQLVRFFQRATAGKLAEMLKPTIAALPGAAAGAGLSLALACDLRIMARTAVMKTAFATVGMAGDFGGSYFLTQLVGTAKARELYMLSEKLDAETALALGLTNWVCDSQELAAKTQDIARRLAQGPTVALRAMKENLNRALHAGMHECLDMEATHHVHSALTDDHREAVQAFVGKRQPSFVGR
jgi:2-(1,2-epoxy-1,2-dihydrophenyl)acetyl-CoA isomerase